MKKLFHISFLSIVLFCLVMLTPNNSYSQSYQTFRSEMEQIAQAKWRIGPFRIYPTIRFRNIGYDSNVYGGREEEGSVSDYTATISPQVRAYFLFRNWLIFSFSENPEYVYYIKEKWRSAFSNSYSPGLRLLIFNRFILSGNYEYRKTNRRATSEFDVPTDIESKGYNISFFYETARSTSFGFSWAIRKINHEDITLPGREIYYSRVLNREEISRYFEFYYRIFPEGFFFIRGGYTEYKFEDIESRFRDSYSYQVYSGIRFPILGRVRGTLSLGYKKFIPNRGGRKSFSGLVGDTGLDFRIGRFSFRVLYQRDCHFSFGANYIFFPEDRYGTGISFYLSRFLRLDYNFTYSKSNYPEMITIRMPDGQEEEIKRKDIYSTHTAGFAIRVIGNTGIGLMVNYWERESNIPMVGRDRWFVGGYVTYEF